MDTTVLQATTFGFLVKMNHKSWEQTTHFFCVECNWSHRRCTHTLLLPIFHPLKLVQVSSKHQLWKFKACFYSTQVFVALLLAPPLGSSPALTSHSTIGFENEATRFAHYCTIYWYLFTYTYMQNLTLQLTLVLRWLVAVKVTKSTLNGRYTIQIQNQQQ